MFDSGMAKFILPLGQADAGRLPLEEASGEAIAERLGREPGADEDATELSPWLRPPSDSLKPQKTFLKMNYFERRIFLILKQKNDFEI